AVQARANNGNAYVSKTLATGQAALNTRGYFYLSNAANFGAVQLLALYSNGTFLGWVSYVVDPTSPSMEVYIGANNTHYSCSAVPTLNAWHSVELALVVSTTASGSFGLWLDGTSVCSA